MNGLRRKCVCHAALDWAGRLYVKQTRGYGWVLAVSVGRSRMAGGLSKWAWRFAQGAMAAVGFCAIVAGLAAIPDFARTQQAAAAPPTAPASAGPGAAPMPEAEKTPLPLKRQGRR